jgi:D-alanyl-D-alanine dipeptidase
MTVTTNSRPVPFTREDCANRMGRVSEEALEVGLDGVIVTPGPDLVGLTGYQPTAITERLTMLVISSGRRPTLLVPALERPSAEAAEGRRATSGSGMRFLRR